MLESRVEMTIVFLFFFFVNLVLHLDFVWFHLVGFFVYSVHILAQLESLSRRVNYEERMSLRLGRNKKILNLIGPNIEKPLMQHHGVYQVLISPDFWKLVLIVLKKSWFLKMIILLNVFLMKILPLILSRFCEVVSYVKYHFISFFPSNHLVWNCQQGVFESVNIV